MTVPVDVPTQRGYRTRRPNRAGEFPASQAASNRSRRKIQVASSGLSWPDYGHLAVRTHEPTMLRTLAYRCASRECSSEKSVLGRTAAQQPTAPDELKSCRYPLQLEQKTHSSGHSAARNLAGNSVEHFSNALNLLRKSSGLASFKRTPEMISIVTSGGSPHAHP
jgi:hypothetical protein